MKKYCKIVLEDNKFCSLQNSNKNMKVSKIFGGFRGLNHSSYHSSEDTFHQAIFPKLYCCGDKMETMHSQSERKFDLREKASGVKDCTVIQPRNHKFMSLFLGFIVKISE